MERITLLAWRQRTKRSTSHKCISHKHIFSYALILLCACALLFLSSCAKEVSSTISPKAEIIKAAENVLVEMHFPIEKADVENGIVKTRPLPGAQFFEVWRSDNIGLSDTAIANMHSIRRTAEIRVTDNKDYTKLDCLVRVQRLSLPGREVDSTAGAFAAISRSSQMLQTLQLGAEQTSNMDWVDIGEDKQLESEIIQRIKKAAPAKIIINNTSTTGEEI
jgi:hypothetical protein